MAINQKIIGEMAMISKKSLRRRSSRRIGPSWASRRHTARHTLAAASSTASGKSTFKVRRSKRKALFANTNTESAELSKNLSKMIKRLHLNLVSLRSLLPPSARSSQSGGVIADAVRYKNTLEKEIQSLLAALPHYHQVDVKSAQGGGLQIGVTCKKKSGVMVALMEAMESFGLHFTNISVSCEDGNIKIDAQSSQENDGEKAGALKAMLVATISRFSQRR